MIRYLLYRQVPKLSSYVYNHPKYKTTSIFITKKSSAIEKLFKAIRTTSYSDSNIVTVIKYYKLIDAT